jgi:hypothetical protein
MYLLGRLYGTASVVKFNKYNFQNDYNMSIQHPDFPATTPTKADSPMHDILSFVQPPNSGAIYGCGFSWADASTELNNAKRASIFKMDASSGDLIYMKMWGKWESTAYNGGSD